MKEKIIKFVVCLVLCQGAGLIGSFFTFSAISDWYFFLNKPEFSPPNWIFGPVWITLYTLMAVALFLVWQRGLSDRQVRTAIWVFMAQLVLNALWSILFFGLKSPLLALVDILIMWVLIVLTMNLFYKIRKVTFWLLLPYLLWVSFATVLNFSIWKLN